MIHPILDWLIMNINEISLSWFSLSNNPNTTFDLVKKYINKPWDWFSLSKHKNITWNIIINNPTYNWDWIAVSQNPNITWEIIENNLNYLWSFKELSCHPNIKWEIIKNNPKYIWDFKVISFNPNISWDIIFKNNSYKWDYQTLIYNNNIYWEMINNNPKVIKFLKNNLLYDIDILFDKLDWLLISQDKRLNIETINYINNNCYITKKQKELYPEKTNYEIINSFWYINQIISNTNFDIINIEYIQKYIISNIIFNENLLLNHNLEINEINYIISKYWNEYLSYNLSKNPKIDDTFFNEKNKKYFCNIGYYLNPNITLNYIQNNMNNNIYWLCHNHFYYNDYYVSNNYKKKLVKNFIDKCLEELIKKACRPSRLLNWNDDVLLDCPDLINYL
jgi:hypothetical protein